MRKTGHFLSTWAFCVITFLTFIFTNGPAEATATCSGMGYSAGESTSLGNEQRKTGRYERPRLIHSTRPLYPAEAKKNNWEGTVILRIAVAEDGSVTNVDIARSSGYELLDIAAVEAARTWRFTPARENNKAISCGGCVPVKFHLVDDTLPSSEMYKIQQRLNDLGFDCGEPDGTMNKPTIAAVTNFQLSKGLQPNGTVDQDTIKALGLEFSNGQ